MMKRFLVPVLVLAACGLPAGASIVEYCSGSNCGATTQSAFNNLVTLDSYTYDGLETFNVSGDLTGSIYTDSTTGIIFQDFEGHGLTDDGGILTAPGGDTIEITIPDTILAISMTIYVGAGLCDNYCAEGETSGFLGFINDGSPTSPWIVSISALGNQANLQIDSFNAASAGVGADTPEVGTLLLIGTGLISMRWMRRLPKPRFFRSPQTA